MCCPSNEVVVLLKYASLLPNNYSCVLRIKLFREKKILDTFALNSGNLVLEIHEILDEGNLQLAGEQLLNAAWFLNWCRFDWFGYCIQKFDSMAITSKDLLLFFTNILSVLVPYSALVLDIRLSSRTLFCFIFYNQIFFF